jgi:tryptophanyl-tRNA synthetase
LAPIRERREALAGDTDKLMAILKKGTEKANQVANATLAEVKDAMGINYF